MNNDYYACSSGSEIEFFDISTGSNVHCLNVNTHGDQDYENILTLCSMQSATDKTKRILIATGTSRTIYTYKVDLLLKCASMPMYQL